MDTVLDQGAVAAVDVPYPIGEPALQALMEAVVTAAIGAAAASAPSTVETSRPVEVLGLDPSTAACLRLGIPYAEGAAA